MKLEQMSKLRKLLEKWPPCLCRLLARHNKLAITSRELSRLSGMDRDRIDYISWLTSWASVRNGEMLNFIASCGIDPLNARRHTEFIKRNNWGHLGRSRKRRYYARLMARWMETLK